MNHLTEEQSSPMPKFVLQNEAVPTPVIVNYNIPPHLAMQRGEYLYLITINWNIQFLTLSWAEF